MSVEFIRKDINIPFAQYFLPAGVFSLVLTIACLALFMVKGFNYGVDFEGGAEVQIKFSKTISVAQLRDVLNKASLNAQVQSIGDPKENEYIVKVKAQEENLNQVSQHVVSALSKDFESYGFSHRKTDIVGPKAGDELRISGFKAMAYALLAIMVYVGLRFDFKYAPGAIVATLHDVIVVMGVFSLTGKEFTLQIVAALLTVIGYSVNDTVIVYDRVREKEDEGTGQDIVKNISSAINETLSRTILTASTTLFVSVAMWFWGGPSIADFFFAVSLGVVVGTYSSIFIAAPVVIYLNRVLEEKSDKEAKKRKTKKATA